VDANRFDRLTVAVAAAASSRRSLLRRIGGGSLATALAALGIGGVSPEDAEAKKAKSCTKRCNKKAKKKDWSAKKKKACKDKCKAKAGGGGGGSGGGGNSSGAGIRINAGGTAIGLACSSSAECASGFCELGLCAPCLEKCHGECCVIGAFCHSNLRICVFR
jgi:hypothetical protein